MAHEPGWFVPEQFSREKMQEKNIDCQTLLVHL